MGSDSEALQIVIEILSKGSENTRRDRVVKRALYSKHGVLEYWIIDCQRRVVEIYRLKEMSLEPAVTFAHEDTLTTVTLPGFSCAVSEIFERI